MMLLGACSVFSPRCSRLNQCEPFLNGLFVYGVDSGASIPRAAPSRAIFVCCRQKKLFDLDPSCLQRCRKTVIRKCFCVSVEGEGRIFFFWFRILVFATLVLLAYSSESCVTVYLAAFVLLLAHRRLWQARTASPVRLLPRLRCRPRRAAVAPPSLPARARGMRIGLCSTAS